MGAICGERFRTSTANQFFMSEERIEGLGPGIVTKVAGKGDDAVHPTEYLVAVVLPTRPVGDFRAPAGDPDMARVEPAKAREV